jgi:hypothetical protein
MTPDQRARTLNFSLNNPVDIEIQPSYDGTVNLILTDNLNPPRLINSRFSATEGKRYYVVDRFGTKDTNLYNFDKIDSQTKLYKTINKIPKLDFVQLLQNGKLPVGNYVFYFRLVDADDNETDIITESGVVSCHIGGINDPLSIRGGIGNENSGKSVIFKFIDLDSNYNFLNILLPSPVTGGVQVYLGNTYALHLADGIALVNNYLGQTFSGNALANIDYGWDGSQWVKDNTGSKVCHTADQALINGLLIRFQNGASNPQFSLNEYYTQGLNFGLLKDNATDLEITAQWYSKSVYYANINITIPSIQITLPVVSGEQYFRIIETDDTTLHSLKIANIPVTKIYTDLVTVPLASEIRLQSNGVVAFNSADVGKSFTGKYLWISS